MKRRASPLQVTTVAVVGGGIHGAHIISRLLSEPAFSPTTRRRIALIDPYPEPFSLWRTRVANCAMPYLRSPASHGVSASFRAIGTLAKKLALEERWSVPPYHRPSIEHFDRHLRLHAEIVADPRVQTYEARLEGIHRDRAAGAYRLVLDSAPGELVAENVVLATGQSDPAVPSAFRRFYPYDGVDHVHRRGFTRDVFAPGDSVLLVGGGIAAAHLAVQHAHRPLDLAWWHRDPIAIHQFDSNPCFIGPRCRAHWNRIIDPSVRRRLIDASRRPGSLPPDLAATVFTRVRRGLLTMVRGEAVECRRAGGRLLVGGEHAGRRFLFEADHVVLATGFQPGVPNGALIESIARELSLSRAADGFPLVDHDLRWTDRLFLTGALAELELGPPARNIIGAHLAGRRIVPAIARSLKT